MSTSSDPSAYLAIARISRHFGDVRAVDDVSLTLRRGEFFCLLGASGCGKTTLMRIIAGFERPDSGQVILDGQDITGLPPHRRPVNMMFQSYALFPHLSVARNIAFGLEEAGLPRAEIAARVSDMLGLVRLEAMADRKPDALSGGQRQRVALARALARRPGLLLLDEPLGALDKKLREDTQIELKAIQAQLGTTFLVVTHDQDEALGLADRIAVMDHGRIVQIGTPEDIYERPAHMAVARLVGDMTAFRSEHGWQVIRPEHIRPLSSRAAKAHEAPVFHARVTGATYRGDVRLVHLAHDDGTPVLMRLSGQEAVPPVGERLALTFDPAKARIVPA